MTVHFMREVDRLKRNFLSLGAAVEERVRYAVQSVSTRNRELAERVIGTDDEIDRKEVEIEEDCLKILALHQPLAADLRFLISVLKINNDLERIGDLAVNIAQRAAYLAENLETDFKVHFDFDEMAEKTQAMLKKSLDSLVNMDSRLAREVRASDDEIDKMNYDTYQKAKNVIRHNVDYIDWVTHFILVSRHLERIADHATNIAEDVIYLTEGEIVRHRNTEPV